MDIIEEDIVIVGAGIAGLAASLGLHRLGLRSLVLESSDCLRTTGFALSLWTNAWKALDALGIGHRLRESSMQIQGLQIASMDSGRPPVELSLVEKFPNHEGRCIKRKELLETMEKELPKGTVRYASKVVSIEESGHLKVLQLADGSVVRTKVLIGCDGVNSMVARWLGLQKPVDTGRSAIRGFVDYPEGQQFKPKPQVYFGGGLRLGFIPCDEKSMYWFCTIHPPVPDWNQDMAQDPVKMKEFVLNKCQKLPNIPKEVSNLLERTKLDSISCAALKLRLPWDILMRDIARRGVCVAGDALHPMTPDIGQGGCSALEDSVVLAKCIGDSFLKLPKKVTGEEEDDAEMAATFNKGVENFAKARKWRSFSLVTAAFLLLGICNGKCLKLFLILVPKGEISRPQGLRHTARRPGEICKSPALQTEGQTLMRTRNHPSHWKC
ncbi:hypothetical protein M9H77_24734 [Catharanthus roseus]|uniref:Uncharacterized protein n=1 Tax=Catharanthus roseus TaxID=4058 RepID=A0ACC0A5S3_CATRO|nr:hypothetical protein M9H77_24734 [Catharanthus roseus]